MLELRDRVVRVSKIEESRPLYYIVKDRVVCVCQKYLQYPFYSFYDALTLEIRDRVVRVSKIGVSRPFYHIVKALMLKRL